jgi:hypothetical protein
MVQINQKESEQLRKYLYNHQINFVFLFIKKLKRLIIK